MKNFNLNSNTEVLSKTEMKSIIGGVNGCTGTTKSNCYGRCGTDKDPGDCKWQEAMPHLGLAAGCVCDLSPQGGQQ